MTILKAVFDLFHPGILLYGGVLSTLVVVGAKVVCMAVEKCPFGTHAQTTVSVFSVLPFRSWACCRIVDLQFHFRAGQAGMRPRFTKGIVFERSLVC